MLPSYVQMEREIEELRRQRDLAQSQVDELRKKLQEDQQVGLYLFFLTLLMIHFKFIKLLPLCISGPNPT